MRRTLICYTGDSRRYLDWIEAGQPWDSPSDLPFRMHKAAAKGDRYLVYVGGPIRAFVGYGTVTTGWRQGRTAGWRGSKMVEVHESILREPVTGDDVAAATGFGPPKRSAVVDPAFDAAVWRAARGKSLSSIERAMEGATTEARSKSRNAHLRQAAIAKANGVCAGCRRDFRQMAGGLGLRCLVVHHQKQLKDTDQPVESSINDLVVLCANCHMMVHANSEKAISVARLRSLLKKV